VIIIFSIGGLEYYLKRIDIKNRQVMVFKIFLMLETVWRNMERGFHRRNSL